MRPHPLCAPQQDSRCQGCSHRTRCLPVALELDDMASFETIIRRRAPLKKGEPLLRQGSPFVGVYAVRSGSLKQVTTEGGDDQLTHFYLPSELIGLDGLDEGVYPGQVVALETSTVCEIPFDSLDALSERMPMLRNQLYRSMSKEMREDLRMIRLLSHKNADQRLATFFVNFSDRFRRRGYSPYSFRLSMTRADIGNYLGLAVETISRVLTRFQQQGLIRVSGREIHILDLPALVEVSEEDEG
ncbi:fumarate/nitrate reduction transcriptional regulator Fnr [Halomonas getboli]|uniref:fumarate/nitrate reduction transcriptional regulator Fnr n=1 Tax=Halomonas getboli TaxID=2935862 RepID=UPI001FFFB11C|nr:fumarate/nitrate reduction transcriptional regulator Fnr [Halomonas getboli]MCK2182475.1 fumarate/nitrate reduction transcriptional regulator Fnr [Halomonas getboli]